MFISFHVSSRHENDTREKHRGKETTIETGDLDISRRLILTHTHMLEKEEKLEGPVVFLFDLLLLLLLILIMKLTDEYVCTI